MTRAILSTVGKIPDALPAGPVPVPVGLNPPGKFAVRVSPQAEKDPIARCLLDLAALCVEVSTRRELLPVFLGILRLVPATIEALQRERRRA